MLLSEISKIINCKVYNKYKTDKIISYLSTNSNFIKKNSIFAIDSKKNIKIQYINEALKKGAVAIISNKVYSKIKVTQFIVKNINYSIDKILNSLNPYSPNNFIAVTGTNGKTSVVSITSSILKNNKIDSIHLGTLGLYKKNKKTKDFFLTTPEREIIFQSAFSKRKQNNQFIFEASSHGISKKRIRNLPINIAAITNITQDHLDYHKNFSNYKKTKIKLFTKYLKKNGTAVLNDNIKNIKKVKSIIKNKNIITYGKKNSDIFFYKEKNQTYGKIFKKIYLTNILLDTNFELQNVACATCICLLVGISPAKIIGSLKKINKPKGRMQPAKNLNNKSKVFIDYAHTPDALKNVLISNTKKIKPNLVIGCGGNRDKNKRKKMGKIANLFANKVYITDDNPRDENPIIIRKEIIKNCPKAIEIASRKKAIKLAINELSKNQILIIAGKGHEEIQIFKKKRIFFSDIKIANHFISLRNKNEN